MDCKVIKQDKHIELWVSNDAEESEIAEAIRRCRGYGLPLVVYRSGTCHLTEITGMLLRSNSDCRQTKQRDQQLNR